MSRILIFALAAVLSTPPAPPRTHTAHSVTLMAIEGAAFDRAFAAQMIEDNLEAAEALRTGSNR